MNLPNKLTMLRIILIPVFIAVFFIDAIPYRFIISAVIFACAAITDYFDGKIARKYSLVTDLGKLLDPIADKVLVSTALIIMLVSTPAGMSLLPWYASIGVAVILARELLVSAFRMIAASKNVVIAADMAGKIKTFLQDIAIFLILIGADIYVHTEILWMIGMVIFWISVVVTIVSGIECLVKNARVIENK